MAKKKPSKKTEKVIAEALKNLDEGKVSEPVKLAPPTFPLEFQEYEIEYLQRGLELLRQAARGPWKQKEDGSFWYEETAEQRRIDFVSKSIKRQLSRLKGAGDASGQ